MKNGREEVQKELETFFGCAAAQFSVSGSPRSNSQFSAQLQTKFSDMRTPVFTE